MADRILAHDWASTPLGPIEQWPAALTTSLGIALDSRFPMILWWGPEMTVLYNDAYAPILAGKHPGALGQPGLSPAAWGDPEVRRVIEPMLRGVLDRGEATWSVDQLLVLERNGYPEEAYFTWSYSPIRDDGRIVGIFTAVSETSGSVIGARRLRVLSELTAATFEAPTVEDVCRRAASVLSEHTLDVPFSLTYLYDGDDLELAASSGAVDAVVAEGAALGGSLGARGGTVDVAAMGWTVPAGAWPEDVGTAAVLPLAGGGEIRRLGFMVIGLSPRLPHDADYGAFVDLLASRVASAIGDARALEEERRRAEALAELDRSKSVFFSNVSHEFRTPLTLMLGPLEDALAEGAGASWATQQERLETARSNGLRLLKLVNSLLDFSRLEAGRMTLALSAVDAATLTEHLVSVFRSAFAAAGLDLALEIGPVGPAVQLDVEMWETIVFNLVSNALKYTERGGARVTLHPDGDDLVLSVSDSGVGIDPAELPQVFERFYRSARGVGRSVEGTGIGLALVRELVRLHGGDVTVDSTPGAGSTFTVRVPRRPARGPVVATAGAGARAQSYLEEAKRWLDDFSEPGPLGDTGRTTVLVVDDNADVRRYLRNLLGTDHRVVLARNGAEGLEMARSARPDVIISDVMMPVLDGLGMLAALRDDRELRDTPVLLLSARAGSEATLDGLAHGADDYLVKPFSGRELVARVTALLSAARRRDQTSERDRQRRRYRLAITDLASELNAATTPEEVAGCAYRALGRAGPLLTVTVSMLDATGEMLEQTFGRPDTWPDIRARYARIPIGADTPQSRAVRTGQTMLCSSEAEIVEAFPAASDLVRIGARAMEVLPFIGTSGDAFGCLTLAWTEPAQMDATRVIDLQEAAEIVGQAMQRVGAQELERRIARTFQLGLLGVDAGTSEAVVRTRYRASDVTMEVGGDWYDVIDLGDGRLSVAVGDVVGQGLRAATVMGQLRAGLATAALLAEDPAAALEHLDLFARHVPGARCATVVLATVDTRRSTLSYCRAGHPPPLLITPGGRVEVLEGAGSLPLGIDPSERRSTETCEFPSGSLLLLYTDGLVERRGESMDAGIERLRALVRQQWNLPLHELEDTILAELGHDLRHRDDIAIVAVRTVAAAGPVFATAFRADPAEVRPARHQFMDWLVTRDVPAETRDDLLLALGEASANAVEHGSGGDPSKVVAVEAADVDGEIVFTVSDSGSWQSGIDGFISGRGHGHTLMQALVDRLEVHNDHQGTVVTMRRAV